MKILIPFCQKPDMSIPIKLYQSISNECTVQNKIRIYTSIIFFFLTLIKPINAQVNGFFFDEMPTIVGARAQGLGGAYTAVVNDATALFWNPGALGLLESSSLTTTFNAASRFGSIESDFSDPSVAVFSDIEDVEPYYGFNHASLAIPFELNDYNIRIVPAISYHQVSNYRFLKETWNVEYLSSPDRVDYLVKYNNSGGVNAISVGLGLGLSDYLGIGMAYNFYTGSFQQNLEVDLKSNSSTIDQFTSTSTTFFGGGGLVFGLKASTNPIYETVYAPGDEYESGFDFGFTVSLPHQRNDLFQLSENENDTVRQITNKPLLLRGGVVFRVPEVLISVDYTYANFSNARRMGFNQYNSGIAYGKNIDLQTIAVGVEFNHNLSLGLFNRNYQFEPSSDLSNSTLGLSAGISVGDESVIFDLSAMFEFFEWNIDQVGALGDDLIYSGTHFNIMAGLRLIID